MQTPTTQLSMYFTNAALPFWAKKELKWRTVMTHYLSYYVIFTYIIRMCYKNIWSVYSLKKFRAWLKGWIWCIFQASLTYTVFENSLKITRCRCYFFEPLWLLITVVWMWKCEWTDFSCSQISMEWSKLSLFSKQQAFPLWPPFLMQNLVFSFLLVLQLIPIKNAQRPLFRH